MSKIVIGSDHAGFETKAMLIELLQARGLEVTDCGCYGTESVNYPEYGIAVAEAVSTGKVERGILICGTGIGMSIAANKIPGIRAAAVSDCFTAKATRQHNDSNILCLGERTVGPGLALMLMETFLTTEFEGGRHQTRVDMISALEK
jgi:ribose 5-phosphate isomerase B